MNLNKKHLIYVCILVTGVLIASKTYAHCQKPVAQFTISPATFDPHEGWYVCMGESLTFDASSSFDPDAGCDVVSWRWTFGDGASATGEIVNHTYTSSGAKTVTLTVTDNDRPCCCGFEAGCSDKTDISSMPVTVFDVQVGALDRVPPTKTRNVLVTVTPSLPGGATPLFLDVIRTAGTSGSATVSPTFTYSTTTVTVTGGTQTSLGNANNLRLRAMLCPGSCVCDYEDFSVCAHPMDFRSTTYVELDPVAGDYYGLAGYYKWDGDSGSQSDLDGCRLAEDNHSYCENRQPFYMGSAPPEFPPIWMDCAGATDLHGAHKDHVKNYTDGTAEYENDYNWLCWRCLHDQDPSDNYVSHHVYDDAASPPPSDWRIETDKTHTCPGPDFHVDQDIP